MSNWASFTGDSIKALGYGTIVDRAASLATGADDPVATAIAGAVSRVRRAIQPANVMDADPTKVPNSLLTLAIRIALFALMERIGLPRSIDQGKTFDANQADLKRITDNRLKVEMPDTPASSAEIQPTGHAVDAVNVPRRRTGGERTAGL